MPVKFKDLQVGVRVEVTSNTVAMRGESWNRFAFNTRSMDYGPTFQPGGRIPRGTVGLPGDPRWPAILPWVEAIIASGSTRTP